MKSNQKQQKITTLFRKHATKNNNDSESDVELQMLEQILQEKKSALSEAFRKISKRNKKLSKNKENEKDKPQSPDSEELNSRRKELEAIVMLSGMEVVSYEKNRNMCIHYHMQHDAPYRITHGINIDLRSEKKEISKASMPVGFNLDAVLEQYESVMLPDCLRAIYKALMAYYDRLQQFRQLQESLNAHIQLFKLMDGSFVQMVFPASRECDEYERLKLTLVLKYRIYDNRPKELYFVESDLPAGACEILTQQCAIFQHKPLLAAFRKAFLKGNGPYKLVQLQGAPSADRPAQRNKPHRPHNQLEDDTYLPEDDTELEDD